MSVVAVLGNAEANGYLSSKYTHATVWLGLHITDPTPLGSTSSEALGNGYKRQRIIFAEPSGKAITNTNNITYSVMPPVTITHLALWTDQFSGTIRWIQPLASPILVPEYSQFLIAPGDVTFGL